ncbi:hypothetical protein [Microbacterium testaceum]|uniref:hypothetical protein n=1 Tax=Microbacterium testaceum TaxID=2033 RepID=UPI001D171DA1|nr:hypothetical protein [Microbacterium testaceum]MCC4250787.1 hypothetical protein [Microbacterium testaceum]
MTVTEGATRSVTHEVVGGAVVLRTKAGSATYIYKGGVFDADLFTEASVAHALSVGLVAEVAAPVVEKPKATAAKAAAKPQP